MDDKSSKRKFFGTNSDDKPLVQEPLEEGDKFSTTVQCPVHNLPLQVQTENREADGKTNIIQFAVCNCPVEGNTYAGKRVWEKS